jgi:leucyl aminopeptidase
LRFRLAPRQSSSFAIIGADPFMSERPLPVAETASIPVHLFAKATWEALVETAPQGWKAAARLAKFSGGAGDLALATSGDGALAAVLFGLGDATGSRAMSVRALAAKLPPGDYRIEAAPPEIEPGQIALAWRLGAYRFDRYKKDRPLAPIRLEPPPGVDIGEVGSIAEACALARDMVNTPANDMGPNEIETVAREIAGVHGAEISVIRGDDLLDAGYPLVHAVGRAADARRSPRFLEIAWGRPDRPVVALIGKGVVFDSGGLDIKPSAGMRHMKKDMGGAAHALALGGLIMAADIPARLHLLVPVVENAISGNAIRPGDVLPSRKGLSVEIGNTDAEGRLILADALTRADELSPALTVDLATLTGAARVALGPDVVPFYTDDDALAAEMANAAERMEDPLWRMPIWEGYASGIESDIADLKNDPDAWVQAGSVAAALFLKRFAPKGAWLHCDIFAWNPRSRPGWPQGAEAQAIRAIFQMLKARYR